MSWSYSIKERAIKQLKKLDPNTRKRILSFLDDRINDTEDPRKFGKELKGDKSGIWRYRVGDYRILCQIIDNELVVLVVAVAHRREAYD